MGLYDRDYMREDRPHEEDIPPRRRPLWVIVVAVVISLSFLLSVIL
ncbi:MAG: hypothetical protein ABII00_12590 [Elusimicrobiota bacterium]